MLANSESIEKVEESIDMLISILGKVNCYLEIIAQDEQKESKIKDIELPSKSKKVDTLKTEITTKQIDGLVNLFRTTPLVSKYQIYIVFEADKLNRNAANKLLKFLEEPEEDIKDGNFNFDINENLWSN